MLTRALFCQLPWIQSRWGHMAYGIWQFATQSSSYHNKQDFSTWIYTFVKIQVTTKLLSHQTSIINQPNKSQSKQGRQQTDGKANHPPSINSSDNRSSAPSQQQPVATRCKPKENPGAASVQRSARRSHRATIPHRHP